MWEFRRGLCSFANVDHLVLVDGYEVKPLSPVTNGGDIWTFVSGMNVSS